jgi:hypothetical protein
VIAEAASITADRILGDSVPPEQTGDFIICAGERKSDV